MNKPIIRQNSAAWNAGYDAAIAGKPQYPAPAGVDALSYFSGWIEGKAQDNGERADWFAFQKAESGNPYL